MELKKGKNNKENFFNFNDESNFELIYKSFYFPLKLYATKFLQIEDATDILEEVFLNFWYKKKKFNSNIEIRAYLYRSVHNACLDFIKLNKRASERNSFFSENSEKLQEPHIQLLIKSEVWGEIYRAINELPLQCGKVVSMAYIHGMTNKDIAAHMEISEQSVKNHKSKALSILRNKLSKNTFLFFIMIF